MRFILLGLTFYLTACTHLLFFPMKDHMVTPDQLGTHYEDVIIKADDGTQLHGWKLYAEDKPARNPVKTLLYFHGNAENISTHFLNVNWLTRYGYDIYLFDYRGYGKSEGKPDLDLIIDDAESMIHHVVAQQGSDNIVVIGQSLGASLSIYAVANSAYKSKVAALVSISGFSDYRAVTQDVLSKSWLFWLFQWPLSFTINNEYSPIEAVAQVTPTKLVIMQSSEDEMIEMYHAERLLEAAQPPKKLILLRGYHNSIFNDDQNKQRLLNALSEINHNQH